MAIEFRCTKCNRLLRTDDETAGRQAKCPQCETIVPIPSAAELPSNTGPAAMPDEAHRRADEGNPYRAPLAADAPPPSMPPSGVWAPTNIDMADVLSRTWRVFQGRFGLCVLVIDVTMLFLVVIQLAANLANGFVFGGLGFGPSGNFGEQLLVQTLVSLPASIVIMVPQVWLQLGIMIFALRIARGEEGAFSDVFSGGRFVGRGLTCAVLILVASVVLLVVCEIPSVLVDRALGNPAAAQVLGMLGLLVYMVCMIVLALFFSQYQALLVDRDLPALQALRVSVEITKGNRLTLFGTFLVLGLIMAVSALPCGVGLIFSIPYMMLAWAIIYLRMTSQPTVDSVR